MEAQSDIEGWQTTRWGMTDSEIVSVVGIEKLGRIARAEYQGLYADLEIPRIDVGRYEFKVIFQMNSETDKLTQVLVQHMPEDQRSEPKDAFNTAKKLLSERFGAPERQGTSDTWLWRFPTTVIDLQYFYIEDIMSVVAVRYIPTARYEFPDVVSAF